MIVQAELQWVLGLAAGLVTSCVVAFWALAKMLIAQSQRHIDAQFKVISETLQKQGDSNLHVERQLMELKADLPRRYVLREDHIRVQASLQVAIDSMRQSLDRYLNQRNMP